MKRLLLLACALACATASAQPAPIIGGDVKPPHLENRDKTVSAPPQVDKEEVTRRGNMVQPMGTIEQGPVDIIADSLSPPENDSDKWFIFVVTKDGDAKSELLKQHTLKAKLTDGTDNPLQAWVKPNEPAKSYAHYNVLRFEDSDPQRGVFKDWFTAIREPIAKGAAANGWPVVILQPPKSGKYGPNKTVVAMVFGYDGSPSTLCNQLRYAQTQYVARLHQRGLLSTYSREAEERNAAFDAAKKDGAKVEAEAPEVPTTETPKGAGQQPPFIVPNGPINPLFPINPNGPDIPPQPQYLTLQQVQQLCPGAPAEYIMRIMAGNPTVAQAQQIAAQWSIDRQQVNPTPAPSIPTASNGIIAALLGALGGGSIMGLIGAGLVAFRNYKKASGQPTYLDDAKFYYILQLLNVPLAPAQQMAVRQAQADPTSPLCQLPPVTVPPQ